MNVQLRKAQQRKEFAKQLKNVQPVKEYTQEIVPQVLEFAATIRKSMHI